MGNCGRRGAEKAAVFILTFAMALLTGLVPGLLSEKSGARCVLSDGVKMVVIIKEDRSQVSERPGALSMMDTHKCMWPCIESTMSPVTQMRFAQCTL
mmetsp:Transcript_35253/g.65310  ORF Transcript_35253/g.65310 Transcript_35253/m.65310 type:complete len:97 (+) Transcript_35253:242-532(+)